MKHPAKQPSASKVTVGKKALWELWAETEVQRDTRGKQLLAMGCFTIDDLANKTGWSRDKAKNKLERSGLRYEVANDPRRLRAGQVRFYFAPKSGKGIT